MKKYNFLVVILLLVKFLTFLIGKLVDWSYDIELGLQVGLLFIFSVAVFYLWKTQNNKLFYLQLPVIVTFFFPILQVIAPIVLLNFLTSRDNVDNYFRYVINEYNYLPYLITTVNYTFYSMIIFWYTVYFFDKYDFKSFKKYLIFSDRDIKLSMVLALYLIGVLSRFLQMYLDIFGYNFDFDSHIGNAKYKIILTSIEQFCVLGFFLITLFHRKKHPFIYISIIFVELFFAFISGFKSNVIFVGVIIFLVEYIQSNQIKLKYFLVLVLLTTIAYAVIEPLRAIRRFSNDNSYTGSLSEAFSTSQEFAKNNENETLLLVTLLERFDIVTYSTRAILHKDKIGLKADDPEFMKHLTFAPFYAVIPRVFWKDKPRFDYGVWFNKNVMWADYPEIAEQSFSSAAMGPIGYLYLCGGLIYVYIYMGLIGFLAIFITKILIFQSNNNFNLLLYFTFLMYFITVDHFGLINHIFKTFPIIFITFKVLSKYATR